MGQERIFTDPVRTFAYGTDASFYRLNPKMVIKVRVAAAAAAAAAARAPTVVAWSQAAGATAAAMAAVVCACQNGRSSGCWCDIVHGISPTHRAVLSC